MEYMKKQTKSILQELTEIGTQHSTKRLVENKGVNLIETAINMLNLIHATYSIEEAEELEKRFLNAIRTRDVKKYKRSINKIHNLKQSDK